MAAKRAREEDTAEEDWEHVIISSLELESERVTITNNGANDVPLKGWTLESLEGHQTYKFKAKEVLRGGETLTIWSGTSGRANARAGGARHVFWTAKHVWADGGDEAVLRKEDGETVFALAVRFEDLPDTPLVTNSPVVISNLDLEGDFVTLYNETEDAIELEGWKLLSAKGGDVFTFGADHVIGGRSFLTVCSGTDGNVRAAGGGSRHIFWKSKNVWGNGGDTAKLYDPHGVEIADLAVFPDDGAAAEESVQVQPGDVFISDLDLEEDCVTITNRSAQDVPLAGWKIDSRTGNQEYEFSHDCVISAGGTLTLWSGKKAKSAAARNGDNHLFWTLRYIWNNNGDEAVLINNNGDEVSSLAVSPTAGAGAGAGAGSAPVSVAITALDLLEDTVTVTNIGGVTASLDGWKLDSRTGDQEYAFADGTVLAAGESLKIWSGKGAKSKAKKAGKNNLYWTARYIWNNHGDEAVLVNEDGEEVSSMAVEPEDATPVDVTISDLDLLEDTVTVTNNGDSIAELSGWKVLSRTGDQEYVLPDGTTLAAGESLKVWSGKGAKSKAKKAGKNNLYWTARYIWNNSGDEAVLVTADGDEVSSMEVAPDADASEGLIEITNLDLEADTVTVTNSSDVDVPLAGWKVISKTGDQEYAFPASTVLGAGDSVTVWSGKGAKTKAKKAGKNNLYWTARYIWNNHGDEAGLVNADGDEVSSLAAGEEGNGGVVISELDLKKDTVTISNEGVSAANIGAWTLLSKTGDQEFEFADDMILEAGESTTLWSGRGAKSRAKKAGENNFFWTARYVWNNNGDEAELRDREGNVVASLRVDGE